MERMRAIPYPTTRTPMGVTLDESGVATWRLWAPKAKQVELLLYGDQGSPLALEMEAESEGVFALQRSSVSEGQRYAYRLDAGEARPDPRSRCQPEGAAGPSAIFSPGRFEWTDSRWRGVPRAGLSIYELHVGTFTPKGTLDEVITRLPQLRELGVSAVELMPLSQFPGERNWGYDGVLPYAVQNSYGGPRALQRLVDAAHGYGIAVILDVVYNHFGPEGCYLREFAPYFTDKYKTPWGDALNYDDRDCDGVRSFVLDNVRMWLEEFHLDGLRLDAVHAIYDLGATHILREIRQVADDVARETGRDIHIIAESDLNDPRIVNEPSKGGHGLDAQWADDFHHAVHSFLTGERNGYYDDYGNAEEIRRALDSPFVFAGHWSRHRRRRHGAAPDGLGGDRFVVCLQNHDQVGNRAVGDRLGVLLSASEAGMAKHRLATSLLLLSPYLPMLFMGEEYGETRPFPYFCSFQSAELGESVRQGRRREFAGFLDQGEEIPDPFAEETFLSAKLSWRWPEGSASAQRRRLYRQLLHARLICPPLQDFYRRRALLLNDDAVIQFIRGDERVGVPTLVIYFNLSDRPQSLPPTAAASPVLFSSELSRFGGVRSSLSLSDRKLLPYECVVLGDAAFCDAFRDPAVKEQ